MEPFLKWNLVECSYLLLLRQNEGIDLGLGTGVRPSKVAFGRINLPKELGAPCKLQFSMRPTTLQYRPSDNMVLLMWIGNWVKVKQHPGSFKFCEMPS